MSITRNILACVAMSVLPASAGVNFVIEFEAGSRWFTETWSAAARAEMQAYFTDLGNLFDSEATVRVAITDNATSAYASAGAAWYQWYFSQQAGGYVSAPGPWLILVKGIHDPTKATDVTINWNLSVETLYGGNPASLISNIRGLGRHEMHHAFGSSSFLQLNSNNDPRGKTTSAALLDTFYRDNNDAPVLGPVISPGYSYTVNNFALAADWATAGNQSGLYFSGRDLQGRLVKMPPISGNGSIDFSHITGISYVPDHVDWSTYNAKDFAFLRAMGYPLAVDSALRSAPATMTSHSFTDGTASFTCNSSLNKHYRLATSTDLRHWKVLPEGKPGTGSPLAFTYPINPATEPKRFFQIVEVPE